MSVTIAAALAQAREQGLARLDAQLLLAGVVQRERSWVLAHDEYTLSAEQLRAWQHVLSQRLAGVPLAYLRGEREFHGLQLRVTPDVLVPRPETETLVEWALACTDLLKQAHRARARVLDLGTGSGAIALAVKHARPGCEVTATDLAPAALAVARDNAAALGLEIRWQCGDWLAAVPGEVFDLIVANPPYVAEGDPHLPDLRHEPQAALTSGPDGLQAIRSIVAAAPGHLGAGGWLLLEHGHEQSDAVRELLQHHGYSDITTKADLAGQARCTGGRLEVSRHR